MEVERILDTVQSAGGQLALFGGKLNAKKLNPETRELVKKHKAELIRFLSEQFEQKPVGSKSKLLLINNTALSWLRQHRQQLRAAGWTPAELYRRNKSKGIVWLELWENENLKISIGKDGRIIFQWNNASGNEIKQTALPDAHWHNRPRDYWPEG